MTDAMPSTPKQTILSLLRRHDALSVEELMTDVGLSKTATRAHLLALEADGLVARTPRRAQTPGRPTVQFQLTKKGCLTFPNEDSALFSQFVAFVIDSGHESVIRDFFGRLWKARRAELMETLATNDLSSVSLEQRIAALESLLDRRHFMPVISRRPTAEGGQRVAVRECNCPLPAAVRATRIPCQLEAEFLADVIGGQSEEISIAEDRRQTCRFEFAVSDDRA